MRLMHDFYRYIQIIPPTRSEIFSISLYGIWAHGRLHVAIFREPDISFLMLVDALCNPTLALKVDIVIGTMVSLAEAAHEKTHKDTDTLSR
jgi:hypothetical protein